MNAELPAPLPHPTTFALPSELRGVIYRRYRELGPDERIENARCRACRCQKSGDAALPNHRQECCEAGLCACHDEAER